MEFKKVSFDDYEIINAFYNAYPARQCDRSTAATVMWRNYYDNHYAVYDGTIVFSSNFTGEICFTYPIGRNVDGMLDELGINNNVSPRSIVANRILSYIRALANKRGSNVLTLYRLVDDKVEALEFYAKKQERFYDKPLKSLNIKENCLVAAIIRESEIIIPSGNDCIKLGDNVIVVTTHKNFDDISDIIE